jgi:hypothetical protein
MFPYILIIGLLLLIIVAQFVFIYRKLKTNHDGQIVITTTGDGKKIFALELNKNPEEIEGLNSISFKVTGEKRSGYEDPYIPQ